MSLWKFEMSTTAIDSSNSATLDSLRSKKSDHMKGKCWSCATLWYQLNSSDLFPFLEESSQEQGDKLKAESSLHLTISSPTYHFIHPDVLVEMCFFFQSPFTTLGPRPSKKHPCSSFILSQGTHEESTFSADGFQLCAWAKNEWRSSRIGTPQPLKMTLFSRLYAMKRYEQG